MSTDNYERATWEERTMVETRLIHQREVCDCAQEALSLDPPENGVQGPERNDSVIPTRHVSLSFTLDERGPCVNVRKIDDMGEGGTCMHGSLQATPKETQNEKCKPQ